MCHFVLVFFSSFSIAITSLGEERANLSAFSTFVRFVLVWICRFPLPLGVWEGLRFVTVALPGLFSYFFVIKICLIKRSTEVIRTRWQNVLQDPLHKALYLTSETSQRNTYNHKHCDETKQRAWWRSEKRVREKSRECLNHKPQPFPDTKRKRKQTKPNKRKSNKLLFPGDYSIIHCTYLCSTSEGGNGLTSVFLWLVSQSSSFHRDIMEFFGWRQLPCPVLHTFSKEVDKNFKQYYNINDHLVFCVLFIH